MAFDYHAAFSRNIGWFTEDEQQRLRNKRAAIAGAGGVGGEHLVTLARLGVGQFHIADFDEFEIHNFNRQAGAFVSTIGRPKCEVMEGVARDINPEAVIKAFPDGVFAHNVDAFLDGVDIYVDSLDFFAIEPRRLVFARCAELGIPAVTAAPLGMGTAFLCFMPGGMTFEDYFGMEGASENEKYLRFFLGLAPASLQSAYLVDPTRLDLKGKKGPSTVIGCKLSAGVAATYAMKILLGRGELTVAPEGMHWDPYVDKMIRTALPDGHRNPEFQERLRQAKALFGI